MTELVISHPPSIVPTRLVSHHVRFTFVGREPRVKWRMTAGNGRILGEAVDVFATHAEAEQELDAVNHLTPLTASFSHPSSGVGWGWTALDPNGTPIAQAGRHYERRATCVTSFTRFISVLREIGAD